MSGVIGRSGAINAKGADAGSARAPASPAGVGCALGDAASDRLSIGCEVLNPAARRQHGAVTARRSLPGVGDKVALGNQGSGLPWREFCWRKMMNRCGRS